ncbi:MAG: hypothetical protein JJU00_08280 [Opitutales bacterium]|nr:hypothetical protein [Opitutales bacterium]
MNGRLLCVPVLTLFFAGCPVVGEDSAPVDAPVGANPDSSSHLRLYLREVRDPGMEDMVSHTVLVPEGWVLQGGVVWTPGRKPFVNNNVGVVGPDGREVWFLPSGNYTYARIPPGLAQYMAMQGQVMPPPGTLQADGSVWSPPPRDAGEYVLRDLLPKGRPHARGARVVDVEHLEDIEMAMRELLAPVIQQLEQSIMLGRREGMDGRFSLRLEAITVEYEEDGTRFREGIPVFLMMSEFVSPDISGAFGGPTVNYNWSAAPLLAARAPVSKYEESEALFIAVVNSMRPTMDWQARIDELERRISQMEHEQRMNSIREFGRVQSEIARTNMEISEMQQSSFEQRMASQDRMSRSFSNAVRDVDDFRRPDGGSVSLPSHYNHVYSDSQGGYLLSKDPHFDPNRLDQRGGWQRIEPVRPTGGAANK